MKLYPIFFLLIFTSQLSISQLKYGLKGGVNFDSSGDIILVVDELQKEGPLEGKMGYHFGVYAEVDFLTFYLRPELQYTKVSSKFEKNIIDTSRIELPVSIGFIGLGPLSFFLGPTAFYNLIQKSNQLKFEDIKNKTTFGLHIGTRLKLGSFGIDLRYNKDLTDMESLLLSKAGVPMDGQINTQPNQFTLGFSFKIK
tara:strand:- start:1013 stop:1603 length:591 start_codon:yes stop_codon:yes gene_type:complete